MVDAELHYAQLYGYDVVMALQYPQNAKNFDSEVNLLKSAGPDILFQASYLADAVSSIETYKNLGFKPRAIIGMNAGFLSPGFIETLGLDTEGLLSREVWAYDLHLAKPVIKSMAGLFQIQTGKTLNGNSARAMTGLFVLADALNRAARLDNQGIRESLGKTDVYRRVIPRRGGKAYGSTRIHTRMRWARALSFKFSRASTIRSGRLNWRPSRWSG